MLSVSLEKYAEQLTINGCIVLYLHVKTKTFVLQQKSNGSTSRVRIRDTEESRMTWNDIMGFISMTKGCFGSAERNR